MTIFDLIENDFNFKEGNILVDSLDMKFLLDIFEKYCSLLCIVPEEDKCIENYPVISLVEYYIYFKKKYIICSEYRQKEKYWYEILEKIKKGYYKNKAPADQIDKINREVFSYYIQAKTNREILTKELLDIKTKLIKN